MAIPTLAARRSSRQLGGHALLVGCGWFPVVFAYLTSHQFRGVVAAAPDVLGGGLTLLIVGAAAPLSWPLLLAAGWYEGSLAGRIAAGDGFAVTRARALLQLEGALVLTVSAVVLMVTASRDGWWAQTEVRFAWLTPALVGGAHVLFARRFRLRP